MLPEHLMKNFRFGSSQVHILFGDFLNLSRNKQTEAIVIIEDNYLSMTGRLSRRLQEWMGMSKVQRVQEDSPVRPGSVVITDLEKKGTLQAVPGYLFFAAVIDFDFTGRSVEELIAEACLESLVKAEDLNLRSVTFQIPVEGINRLTMSAASRSLCASVKSFLAEERQVKDIWLVIDSPDDQETAPGDVLIEAVDNVEFHQPEVFRRVLDFVREANAVLAAPYEPQGKVRQARDFFGRETEMQWLRDLIAGNLPGMRHALLLGGPGIGKWMLLDQLFYQSQLPENLAAVRPFLVRVSFASQLPAGDARFLFRKLIIAMLRHETRTSLRKFLRKVYADPQLSAESFKRVLNGYKKQGMDVVFLCDGFPLEGPITITGTGENSENINEGVKIFLNTLEMIQKDCVFIISIGNERIFQSVSDQFREVAPGFLDTLADIWIRVVSDQERVDWVNKIYQRYLDTEMDAPLEFTRLVEEEAGNHPYLISLACYLMLSPMKRVALNSPEVIQQGWKRAVLQRIAENVRRAIVQPRNFFFDHLLSELEHAEAVDLFNLSRAVMAEHQTRLLGPALAAGDPNAQARLAELMLQGDPRDLLHEKEMHWLINHAYIMTGVNGKQFLSAPALAPYVLEKLGGIKPPSERPADVTVSLLHHIHPASRNRMERSNIRTLFYSRGGRVIATEKNFPRGLRDEFLENFNRFLANRRAQMNEPSTSVFRNVEEIGNFLLSQYGTLVVKRYLENPPPGCTINLLIDESLKEIPWELMLEAAYAGEIPFQVGRSIISNQVPGNVRPVVRGPGQVKALIIGNPTGDLLSAGYEVEWLENALYTDNRFASPDVLMGPQACQRIQVLNALSSGRYGLVHYSGHSRASGDTSAWILGDGEVTTDQLTNAVQAAPPAMVFSSSCYSGSGGLSLPEEYENQAFDLPGAFLGAGVDVYIGTLWDVEEDATRRLVERFYNSFINGDLTLGECLRRSRQSLKIEQERQEKIDWLAFILFGDPRLVPGDLYPIFKN